MSNDEPTMIERLEEYERPAVERAEKLGIKYGEAWRAALQSAHCAGWIDVEKIEGGMFVWGDPEPVRHFAIEDEITWISSSMLALVYGKPQKKDYRRARDFRAARRRHARWKKGRP